MQCFPKRLLVLLLIAAVGGCATYVAPPAQVSDPVTVYIADYGRHASLLLPRDDGLAEYGFGHWRWFALGENWLAKAPPVLLVPGKATLARREIPQELATPPSATGLGAHSMQALEVERARARQLLSELDARFDARRADLVYNVKYDLSFVPDPEPYWAFNNSNTKVADWLSDLGADVRGSGMTADFNLQPPPTRPE